MSETNDFINILDIFDDHNEDTYMKYSYVVDEINLESHKHKKARTEEEKMRKLVEKQENEMDEFVSHADDNDGADIY
jgi:hypothetical protein